MYVTVAQLEQARIMQQLSPAGASVLVGLLFRTPFRDPTPSRCNGCPSVHGEFARRIAQGADNACCRPEYCAVRGDAI